jgi:hypothetical protein
MRVRNLAARLMNKAVPLTATVAFCVLFGSFHLALARELEYECSNSPVEVTFAPEGGHYSGVVNCGNLFLQSDIHAAPVVRWKGAEAAKFYTLMMLDFDGNATGSWPDPVPPGKNAPVRHWIVGNIPGSLLRGAGYVEPSNGPDEKDISILEPYRYPHIPVVSDRYGIYLFEQSKEIKFKPLSGSILTFNYSAFLHTYELGAPKASNFFVVVYISASPFSGKPFHGNDVSGVWHRDYGKGKLTPLN